MILMCKSHLLSFCQKWNFGFILLFLLFVVRFNYLMPTRCYHSDKKIYYILYRVTNNFEKNIYKLLIYHIYLSIIRVLNLVMCNALKIAQFAALKAGNKIMDYYKNNYSIKEKGVHNPVTDADITANDIIYNILSKKFPDYGFLSEETKDSSNRLDKEFVWVIDPLDGTKEFIEGIPHFVVSIGLVKNGKPIVGVLYNPVSKELFYAEYKKGAYYNHNLIQCSNKNKFSNVSIVVSRSEIKAGLWINYQDVFNRTNEIGSVAYKLGLVAANKYDFFVTLKPKNEWDICAGQIILSEAGGILVNSKSYNEPIYNQKITLQTPGLIGGNASLMYAR